VRLHGYALDRALSPRQMRTLLRRARVTPDLGRDDLLDRLCLLDVTKPNGLIVVSRRAGGQKPYAHTPVPGATA